MLHAMPGIRHALLASTVVALSLLLAGDPPAPTAPVPPVAPKSPPASNAPAAPVSGDKAKDADKPKSAEQSPQDDQAAAKGAKKAAGFWYGVEKAPAKKPGSIRIAAYNVENVFDDKDDPALSGEFDDIKMATKPTRLAAIGEAIKRLDADVLSIEEIESLEALTWFRDTYLKGLGYDYVYSEDVGYYRGVEQAFISRYPIVVHKTWVQEDLSDMASKRQGEGWAKANAEQGKKFQRSPLLIQVDVKGYPITLISVHNKAGGKEFDYQRESEALQTIEFVKEILTKDPAANVAVMGDFNASPTTKVVKCFGESGMRSAYDFRGVKKGNTKDLYTTHDSGRPIDHIFMTPGLADDAVDSSFFVLSTMHPESTYKWQDDPNLEKVPAGYASDHYPIAIDITPKDKPIGEKPAAAKPADANPSAAKPADTVPAGPAGTGPRGKTTGAGGGAG